jgi:cytochrome P450
MSVVMRPPRFDLTDPALLDDPYPAYARMRDAGALAAGGPGQWLVSRHAEVTALLRDQRLTKSFPEEYYRYSVGGNRDLSAFLAGMNLGHRDRLASRVLVRSFSPGLVRRLAGRIDTLVDGLLEPALRTGTLDVVTDLALPLPTLVISELLGVPAAEQDRVWPDATALVAAFSDVAFHADKDVTAAAAALGRMREYLTGLLRRLPAGADNLMVRMRDTEEDGRRLSPAEIVDNAITVCYAGFETSASVISNGVVELIRHPDQLRRLRADPSLVTGAVEEILRFEAPIQVTMRSPVEPITVAGRAIRPGRVLYLLLGAANRDPRRFTDPDRFDLGRDPNPHVSFGAGAYHCLGAALARAEGAGVLRRLLRHCAVLESAGEPRRGTRFNFRTYEHVPVAVRRA